eukprot:scaffold14.g1205.t1
MAQIIGSLADPGEDRRQMAGRCLGELVRKMGDRILAQIIPILRARRHVLARRDHAPGRVQRAAGGNGEHDAAPVIPALLAGLDSEAQQGQALEGLRVILSVRPQLLAAMLPKMLRPPIPAATLRALGALCEAAGAAIHPHLAALLPPLLALANQHPDAVAQVALAVQEDGLYLLVSELEKGLGDPNRRRRAPACLPACLRRCAPSARASEALVPLLAEDDADAVQACWEALAAVAGSIPKEMQPSYVRCVREAVLTARDHQRRKRRPGPLLVAGFCLPKALAPVLPIYLQGVLQGASAELREQSAEGLGELVEVTGEEALKPFVVQITGPLIRIMGDRFPWQIKAAILHTLGLLIARAGPGLRPFAPQLQTTFLKCLADPAPQVRQKAAANLGQLSRLSTRLDALVGELAAGARTARDAGVQQAHLLALEGALLASGDRASADTLARVAEALSSLSAATASSAAGDDEGLVRAVASAVGAYATRATPDALRGALAWPGGPLAAAPTGRYGERLGAALAAAAVARHAAGRLQEQGLLQPLADAIVKSARDSAVEVKVAAARAAGSLLLSEIAAHPGAPPPSLPALLSTLVALLGSDQDGEVQRTALAVARRVAAASPGALAPHYRDVVPSICGVVQGSSGPTRLAAERCLAREGYLRRLSKLPTDAEEDEVEL